MKQLKHLIIYLSIFCIVTVSIFSVSTKKVYADVPTSQKVVSHEGSWIGYVFDYTLQGKYFTIQDSTGIQQPSLQNPNFFYTDDQISFYALDGKKLYTSILNKGIGIIGSQLLVNDLFQSYLLLTGLVDQTLNTYIQGGLYDSNNNFLGYCINDITGCYFQQPLPQNQPAVNVPDDVVDDVWNHFDYYQDNDNVAPEYFNYVSSSNEYVLNYWTKLDDRFDPGYKNNFELLLNNYDLCLQSELALDSNTFHPNNFYYHNTVPTFWFTDYDGFFMYQTGGAGWDTFCDNYGINEQNKELLFTDLLSYIEVQKANASKILYSYFDKSTLERKSVDIYDMSSDVQNPNLSNYTTSTSLNFKLGKDMMRSGIWHSLDQPLGKTITIYKDIDAYNSINVDKDYEPSNFKSNIYYNYNINEDNSITINYNHIDNSETNNQNIYDQSTDIFYDEVEKGEAIVIPPAEITIIIENIYPDPVDPDDPTNPDDPDSPSDPDDPDTILDAILDALKRFFEIIGKLLGTVLAGLLEVIDALLESIAGIMENLTGVTDFIGALFSWLPTPVPQVLGVGLSICILAAIIKFIRG